MNHDYYRPENLSGNGSSGGRLRPMLALVFYLSSLKNNKLPFCASFPWLVFLFLSATSKTFSFVKSLIFQLALKAFLSWFLTRTCEYENSRSSPV